MNTRSAGGYTLRKLQYGCGLSAPSDWENYDGSPTLWLQKLPLVGSFLTTGRVKFPKTICFADVTRTIPVPSASMDYVYCSHVLEHLARDDLKSALRETLRILKPGGVFRGVMPDLAHEVDTYLTKRGGAEASVNFMQSSLLGLERRPRGIAEILVSLLGNDRHLYLWDFAGIERELHDAGFISVRRAEFGDHRSDVFRTVEEKGRWDNCLGFECEKPSS